MAKIRTRTLRWVAPLAIAGVVGLAACGDEDATRSTAGAEVGVLTPGSDQHLENMANEIGAIRSQQAASARLTAEAEAHKAATIAAAAGSDQHLENQAAAIEAVAGTNRASQRAEADNYVSSLEQRADASSSTASDEFVPGSRHMPVR
jgi:hypothetical protein